MKISLFCVAPYWQTKYAVPRYPLIISIILIGKLSQKQDYKKSKSIVQEKTDLSTRNQSQVTVLLNSRKRLTDYC